MLAQWGAENQNRLAREAKVGVATVARMKSADTSIGVDVLEKVASALGVQAWQLLCPPEVLEPSKSAPSPLALDLARQLDRIEDPQLQRRAYAVASQVISFGGGPAAQQEHAPAPSPTRRHRANS
ncbi:hypothetical protein vBPaeMUSP25_41 [Pseudomonas phage vB_PaeM_USP_25]|nr:hypothetical protein vBPaeMUSP25_41 [Pseudomonas phage vB_PaeM_USP_25]